MMTTTTTTAPIPKAWEALPDEEVVRRILEGEGALFELLMRRYNQRLYRVARAIVRDEAEAEDVMQQAYVSAYTHLAQFEQRARFSTWLTRIAVHEALARRRRRERITEMDAMPETEGDVWTAKAPDPEQQALTGELRRALEASVDALPESHRSVFVLRDVEGLTTAETAECLGLSEDNVKTRLSRSRAALRRELLARAGGATPDVFSFHLSRCDRVVSAVLDRLGLRSAAGSSPARG
jgi:RNA polymerase sigma-70 factor (ECF subfamily)